MVTIHLRVSSSDDQGEYYSYRAAGQNLVIDVPVEVLVSFTGSCPERIQDFNVNQVETSLDDAKLLYQGPGWIGNEWREVGCHLVSSGYLINVTGVGEFWVAEDGRKIILTKEEGEARHDLIVEAMLGPALIMALAKRGVYCLHGSAVMVGEKAVVFLGESGMGKSTLARWLGAQGEESWRRIGDDIVPVAMWDDGIDVLPHFPQLKLPKEAQPAMGLEERIPLSAVYCLGRPEGGDTAAVRPLAAQAAALALVQHTVASRLFDAGLMANQLDFCIATASRIPVNDLLYPFKLDALHEVQALLANDLQPQ